MKFDKFTSKFGVACSNQVGNATSIIMTASNEAVFLLKYYKLKIIINIIPDVNNANPNNDFLVNLSFKIINENSIVINIASFVIEFTAIGFTPSVFKA